jgi:hypothetical protein
MNKVLEYCKKNSNGRIADILEPIVHSTLFHHEFAMASGHEWLSTIGLGDYGNQENVVKLLVDQIVFESASPDLSGPLESAHICLQTLWGSAEGWIVKRVHGQGVILHPSASSLGEALRWIQDNFVGIRYKAPLRRPDRYNVPSFAQIGINKKHRGRWSGTFRSFEFVEKLSVEEWEEWSNRVKILIMGVNLGGLGCGPTHAQHRFTRDPDGVCGYIYSA